MTCVDAFGTVEIASTAEPRDRLERLAALGPYHRRNAPCRVELATPPPTRAAPTAFTAVARPDPPM